MDRQRSKQYHWSVTELTFDLIGWKEWSHIWATEIPAELDFKLVRWSMRETWTERRQGVSVVENSLHDNILHGQPVAVEACKRPYHRITRLVASLTCPFSVSGVDMSHS